MTDQENPTGEAAVAAPLLQGARTVALEQFAKRQRSSWKAIVTEVLVGAAAFSVGMYYTYTDNHNDGTLADVAGWILPSAGLALFSHGVRGALVSRQANKALAMLND